MPGTDAVYYLLTEGGPCPTEPPVVEPPVEQPPVADGPPVCDPTVVTRSLADAAADCGKDDDTPVVDTPTTVQRKAPPSTHLTALPHTGGSPTVLPMAPVQPSWALYAGLGMLLAGAAYATSLIVRRNRA